LLEKYEKKIEGSISSLGNEEEEEKGEGINDS
jgi:hypothetical protein